MSQRFPALKPKDVLRALQRAGFFIHRQSGSHFILKHSGKPGVRVTVPFHNRELKRKTLSSIIKQAGLTIEEFNPLS